MIARYLEILTLAGFVRSRTTEATLKGSLSGRDAPNPVQRRHGNARQC
jgi:hypothetical protein